MNDRAEAGDDLKDVYAHFGLTFSHGCNVESVLANLILTTDFVKNVVAKSRKAGKPIYSTQECGRLFDEFLAKQHKQMMGRLVGDIKDLIELGDTLEGRVRDALRRRNYLAHHFWRERGAEAVSRKRRDLVVKDLITDQAFFEQLAKDLEEVANAEVTKIGLDGEGLRARVDERVLKQREELAK